MDRIIAIYEKLGTLMRKLAVAPATALVSLLLTVSAWAQDITNLGGDLTSDLPIDTALELPAPNISSEELFQLHLAGHTDFHGSFLFTKLNGKRVLGPHFNHNSCGACHVKDGRGPIRISSRPPGSSVLVKVSLRGLNPDGSPRDVPRVGEQLQNHSIDGSTRYDIRLRWRTVRGVYPDGTKYTLRRPQLSFKIPGIRSTKVVHSIRMSPPTIGMGLLEAVPAATIVAMSDPDDLDGDGISGRVSYVPNLETGQIEVGRFGWRATQPTLKQQAAAAFFHDMGLTNELFLPEGKAQEIPDEQLARVVFYSQAAGVTPARDQDHPDVVAGKALFQQINCDSCHVMTLQTGDSEVVEVANQEFHPFTDLLLHDMGPDLADERPEFSATQREWRTPPLWGLGLHPFLSSKRPGYLHDGRARTIEEAILWHGGEALSSRESFKDLSAAERFQLIRFLQSL